MMAELMRQRIPVLVSDMALTGSAHLSVTGVS